MSSDYKISTILMSQHYDLQKSLFGEIVLDDDFHKITRIPDCTSDDDDFNNAKVYKISNVVNDILYTGVTCNALKTCLSKHSKASNFDSNKESKLKVIFITNFIIFLIMV